MRVAYETRHKAERRSHHRYASRSYGKFNKPRLCESPLFLHFVRDRVTHFSCDVGVLLDLSVTRWDRVFLFECGGSCRPLSVRACFFSSFFTVISSNRRAPSHEGIYSKSTTGWTCVRPEYYPFWVASWLFPFFTKMKLIPAR